MKINWKPSTGHMSKALATSARAKKFIQGFVAEHELKNCDLLLDSTGPSLTKHYLFLSQLGEERLNQFCSVHTFSGGTFAYLGYTAAMQGQLAKPLQEYFKNFDRDFRKTHHIGGPLSPFLRAKDFLLRKSFDFPKSALSGTLDLIFSQAFLGIKIDDLPKHFQPYLADAKSKLLVSAREQSEVTTVRQLLEASILIPFFYQRTESDLYYDAAFARDYRRKIKDFRKSTRIVLASTPWDVGEKGSVKNFKCLESKDPRFEMLKDFAFLSLNIPSNKMNQELEVAFRQLSEDPHA